MMEGNKTLTKDYRYLKSVLDCICNSSHSSTSAKKLSDSLLFMSIWLGVCMILFIFICCRYYYLLNKCISNGHGGPEFGSTRKDSDVMPMPTLSLVQIVSFLGPIVVTYKNGKTEVISGKKRQPAVLYPLGIQKLRKIGQAVRSHQPTERAKKFLHYIHD